MQATWLSLFGAVEIDKGQVTLVPGPPPAEQGAAPTVPHALVRSNLEFDQGSVEMQAYLPDQETRCQFVLGGGAGAELFAGLNTLGAPFGFAALRGGKFEPLGGAGHGSQLQAGIWHNLKLQVKGSNVDLYVDSVKVASTSFQLSRAPLGVLLQSEGRAAVKNVRVSTQQPICFVVMQFTEEYNALYSDVIKKTCEEFGYQVIRGDDFYHSGLIIEDITRSIRESTLVIADVTPDNPNVFYEVGFAHGMGKTTILLSDRKRDKLPFDISGFRMLFYDNSIGGKSAVEDRLRKHLESLGASQVTPAK